MNRTLKAIGLVLIILIAGGVSVFFIQLTATPEVDSFADCVAAGNPVMESYPRQCRSKDGELFVEEVDEPQQGQTLAAEGIIRSLDASEMPRDGPMRITIDTTDERQLEIAVPSMGLPTCAARDDIVDVFDLSVGDRIAVRGTADSNGAIVPCESADHYLRRGDEAESSATTLAVGQSTKLNGLRIRLKEILQESRCPVDAECVEGGAITVRASITSGTSSKEVNIASDDIAEANQHLGYAIGITDVQPPLRSGQTIPQEDYRVTFTAQR